MLNQLIEELEVLSEDNPWHSRQGTFPKGGAKRAKMWSLYGERHGVFLKKGGVMRFRKLSAKRVAKIKQWRKHLGPHPNMKFSHKPPYRAKNNDRK